MFAQFSFSGHLESVKAKYDYVAQRRDQLSFKKGDVIEVSRKMPSGWWRGSLNGQEGMFPSNYVESKARDHSETRTRDREHALSSLDGAAGSSGPPSIAASDYPSAAAARRTRQESYVSSCDTQSQFSSATTDSVGDSFVEDPLYKYVESTLNSASDDINSYWLPQATPGNITAGFVNVASKRMTLQLPFEAIPPNATREQLVASNQLEVPSRPVQFPATATTRPTSMADRSSFIQNSAASLAHQFHRTLSITSYASHNSTASSFSHASVTSLSRGSDFGIFGLSVAIPPRDENELSAITSWAELLATFQKNLESLNEAFESQADGEEFTSRFTRLAACALAIGEAAGIPPRTMPSFKKNPVLAVLYSRMMYSLSRLGLSGQIFQAYRLKNDEHAKKLTLQYLSDAEDAVKDANEFASRFSRKSDKIVRYSSFRVRLVTKGVSKFVIVTLDGRGGGANPNPPFALESFDNSEIPDVHLLSVLNHHVSLLQNAVRIVIQSASKINTEGHLLIDKQRLLRSQLTYVFQILHRFSDIFDSMDLNMVHNCTNGGNSSLSNSLNKSQRRTSYSGASITSSVSSLAFTNTASSLSFLSLIYEFICHKQTLYEEMIDFRAAINKMTAENECVEAFGDFYRARSSSVGGIYEKITPKSTDLEVIDSSLTRLTAICNDVVFRCNLLTEERQLHLRAGCIDAKSIVDRHASNSFGGSYKVADDDDPQGTGSRRNSSSSSTSWVLGKESNLIYDSHNNIKGGTVEALVEQLTSHEISGPAADSFRDTILLTFRSFTSAGTLFSMLVSRFAIQPLEGLSNDEFDLWVVRKQKPIRRRVVDVLGVWLEHYWHEHDVEKFKYSGESITLLQSMLTFSQQLEQQEFPHAADLKELVIMRTKQVENGTIEPRRPKPQGPSPAPIIPKVLSGRKFKYMDVDPLEMARQLTLRDFRLFSRISPIDCLSKCCKSIQSSAKADSAIRKLVRNANQITNWAASTILESEDARKRATTIKYLIQVAHHCRELKNFSTMIAIGAALGSSAVHRLKRTWVLVPKKSLVLLDHITQLMNSSRNYFEYRMEMTVVSPPAIPFFGVTLSDLTFLGEGSPDYLNKDREMINFAKRQKAAQIIHDVMKHQGIPYNFQEVAEIQSYIHSTLKKTMSPEEMYQCSVTIEPKTTNRAEHITRALEENGLL